MSDTSPDTRSAYPTSADESNPPPRPARKQRSSFRFVVPAVLFMAVVAGIAWVTQFMPNWRNNASTTAVAPDNAKGTPVIKFTLNRAVWDPSDPDYLLETEKGKDSHFDFPFENITDAPAELGFDDRSCDCTNLQVCVVEPAEWARYNKQIHENPLAAKAGDWHWTSLTVHDPQGYIVPARGKGLVRVDWHGRKPPGKHLNLKESLWHEPQGTLSGRHFDSLEVPSVVAAPILFRPTRLNLGTLALVKGKSKTAEFTLWSTTRDALDLKWDDAPDRLFTYQLTRLPPDACRAWETQLRQEGANTRVRCAYRFAVTMNDKAGTKALYQGPFYHQVLFYLDGDKANKMRGPIIDGDVKAEVMIGNASERGKVDLQIFRAQQDFTRDFSLWADKQLILEKDSQTPPTLEVALKKKATIGNRAQWSLQVTVPANTQFGPFPDDSVIILRTKTSPPRFIRIPVKGNGQS